MTEDEFRYGKKDIYTLCPNCSRSDSYDHRVLFTGVGIGMIFAFAISLTVYLL